MKKMRQENIADLYRITLTDIILIFIIIFFTTGTVIAAKQGINRPLSNVSEVSVFHEGQIFKEFKLDKDQEIEILDGKVCLEVRDKKLRVKKSVCSHQTCAHMGWIHLPGETIACMPNRILIRIKQDGPPVLDAVVY